MGRQKVKNSLIFIAIGMLIAVYFILRGISCWRQGYSWQEMDWQQQGSTSISDFFIASDIGKREVIQHGQKCIEYYAYKDGLPIKTVFPINHITP